MNSKQKSHLEFFLQEIDKLYCEVKEWLSQAGLICDECGIEITEEISGAYLAKKLDIMSQDGSRIAEIMPVGAWIIGANGRIDLVGLYDRVTIVHFHEGGPMANSIIRDSEGHSVNQTRPFYKGIKEPGWYWIEHKLSSKGHKLTAELFFDILADISDYEHD